MVEKQVISHYSNIFLLVYLQIETASSMGNNRNNNFFNENTFTFEPRVISNKKMVRSVRAGKRQRTLGV